jgi:hypothetical protein
MKKTVYVNCAGCGDLIGPHAPVIEMNYGFLESENMYIEESILFHVECTHSNSIGELLERIEKN